jgi:hypothetical protein
MSAKNVGLRVRSQYQNTISEDIMRWEEAKVAAYGRAWPKTLSFQIDMESIYSERQ